jgi:hypothetical protein
MTNKRIAKIALDEIESLVKGIRENVEDISIKEIDKLREVSAKLTKIAGTVRLNSWARE